MTLDLTGAASTPIFDLDDAKLRMRVEVTDDDALIPELIEAATDEVENYLHRALITQTWVMRLGCFPRNSEQLRLPKPPLQSISSITYIDLAGDSQTWSNTLYSVSKPAGPQAEPGFIIPVFSESYPTTRAQWDAVTVTFVAGYGDASTDIPEGIRTGIALVAGDLYENREATVVGTIAQRLPILDRLIGAFRAELS